MGAGRVCKCSPFVLACLVVVVAAAEVRAQEKLPRGGNAKYPPDMQADAVEVYKTVGDVKLSLYLFRPPDHKSSDRRPAIVFFFGGGWRAGSPRQFEQQCRYLASRGMLAIAADYRVASRHNVKVVSCVADAKSAVRWVRVHAGTLGVDPEKIVAAGGSAGGHLAACTGTITGLDEQGEDLGVSSRPNAMILFNSPPSAPASIRSPSHLTITCKPERRRRSSCTERKTPPSRTSRSNGSHRP
jgi:hypothetical protein